MNKIKIIFFEIIISLSSLVFAETERALHFSVEPTFSIKNGTLGEYVFLIKSALTKSSDTGSTPDDKLSYLEWQIKNEIMMGLKASSDYRNLFATAELSFGFPQNSGIVMDSDWMNIQYSATKEQQTYKTNYSEHDNKINYDFLIGAQAGYKYEIWNGLSVSPFIGFDFSKISFTATDGHIWYGKDISTHTGSSRTKTGPFEKYNSDYVDSEDMSGTVLEYSREETNLWLGADFSWQLPYNITIGCGAKTAAILYTFNSDKHPQAGDAQYTDICWGNFDSYKLNFNLQYQIHRGITATYNFDYYNLNTIRGDSYVKESGDSYWKILSDQQGGASAKFWTSTFGVKVQLL